MKTTFADDPVAWVNGLTPAELAAESARSAARLEATLNRTPYPADRTDSAVPVIKATTRRDATGRQFTEFVGNGPGSIRSWMQPWMDEPRLQIGIYNGSTPEQEHQFRARMQQKLALYETARSGGAR